MTQLLLLFHPHHNSLRRYSLPPPLRRRLGSICTPRTLVARAATPFCPPRKQRRAPNRATARLQTHVIDQIRILHRRVRLVGARSQGKEERYFSFQPCPCKKRRSQVLMSLSILVTRSSAKTTVSRLWKKTKRRSLQKYTLCAEEHTLSSRTAPSPWRARSRRATQSRSWRRAS